VSDFILLDFGLMAILLLLSGIAYAIYRRII
jgi:hypothetical protein